MWRRLISAAVVLALGLSVAGAQTLTAVRVGSVGGATDAPIYLADELGYFRQAGIALELKRMNAAPALTAAIATNQLDVAGIAVSPGMFAAVQQGMKMRVVGDKNSISKRFSAAGIVVRTDLARDSEEQTIKGLKGKAVAVGSKASSPYMYLMLEFKKYGLKLEDVRIVELAMSNMVSALASKAIDAAILIEPFLTQTLEAGVARFVTDTSDVVPEEGYSVVPLVYSEAFAAQRETAQNFMNAYMAGVRIYNDAFGKGKDKDKVIEIIARRTGMEPDLIRKMRPGGFDPDQRVSRASLSDVQDFFIQQGALRTPIDIDAIYDGSFAENAVKQLGPYR
jgi:NitT/TauT family transport system substrate-binding protein